jgi:hypothetical protein
LSNYTHRVGITSRRIIQLDVSTHQVTFRYRDFARGSTISTRSLDTGEFARRFSLHILPPRFTKIRHYGLLANRGRAQRLEKVRAAIAPVAPQSRPTTPSPSLKTLPAPCCPYCGSDRLRLVLVIRLVGRGPPRIDSS